MRLREDRSDQLGSPLKLGQMNSHVCGIHHKLTILDFCSAVAVNCTARNANHLSSLSDPPIFCWKFHERGSSIELRRVKSGDGTIWPSVNLLVGKCSLTLLPLGFQSSTLCKAGESCRYVYFKRQLTVPTERDASPVDNNRLASNGFRE